MLEGPGIPAISFNVQPHLGLVLVGVDVDCSAFLRKEREKSFPSYARLNAPGSAVFLIRRLYVDLRESYSERPGARLVRLEHELPLPPLCSLVLSDPP